MILDLSAGELHVVNATIGTDIDFLVTIRNSGVVVDLTSATYVAKIRRANVSSGTLIATPTITSPSPTLGIIRVQVANAVSASAPEGNWYWGLQINGVATLPAKLSAIRGEWAFIKDVV